MTVERICNVLYVWQFVAETMYTTATAATTATEAAGFRMSSVLSSIYHHEASVTVTVSIETEFDDHNVSTTESPTPSPVWDHVTSCVSLAGLNVSGEGDRCDVDGGRGLGDDNTSTSSTPAAAVAQCSVFVQPWALLLLAFPLMTVFGNTTTECLFVVYHLAIFRKDIQCL